MTEEQKKIVLENLEHEWKVTYMALRSHRIKVKELTEYLNHITEEINNL